jgi:hypothetical protein
MKVESAEHSSPEPQHEGHAPDTATESADRPNRAERRQAAGKTARREARKVPYLQQRGDTYYFHRRYPQFLIQQGYFTGPFCRVSLRTADRLRAERLVRRLAYRFDRLVEAFSQDCEPVHSAGREPVNAAMVLADDVPVLARRFEALLLHSDDLDRSEKLSPEELQEYVTDIEDQRKQLRVANACGDYDAVADDARGFLAAEKLQCAEGSDVWKGLLKEVMLAQLRALRGIVDRLDGEAAAPATPAEAPAPLRSDDDLDDLDRAFAHWQTKARPKPKTVMEAQSILERLKTFTGKSRISALTRSEVVQFQTNEGKRMVGDKRIRPQTVNKMMGLLRAVFGLAVDDLLRERGIHSPLEKLRKEKVKSSDITEKLDLSKEQLDALFGGPVHAQGGRPVGGAGEAAHWMLLLGHTTGGRMSEFAQMSVHEVVVRDGVPCLWLTNRDTDEQVALHQLSAKAREELIETSLKTGASRRIIPLHPRMLELGFMDYVEHMRKLGSYALFPDIKPDNKGVAGGNFSKWFNGYLRRVGIKRRGLDWVSFRHTLKTWMREAEVPQDVQDYVQGHTAERVAQGYGRFTPKTVLAELSKLSFPSLDRVPVWTPAAMVRGRE